MSVEVRPVETRAERRAFVHFPWQIYPGRYPAWVPPLLIEERKRIDPKKNPFFGHGAVELFLAYKGGRVAGRIAAIENRAHNEFHSDRVGFFGMFESEDDAEVASALLDHAAEWVKDRGLDRLRGPTNFSTNDECGLLVDNFEDPPYVMMPYNPPYYEGLLTRWGLEKAKDLLAYESRAEWFNAERFAGVEDLIERSGLDVRVRSVRMDRFEDEVALVRDLYNSAWERNWGFVPMTDAEVDHMAAQLKPVIDPDLVLIGEIDGEPAGFALVLPNVNQAIRRVNGRLFPFGLFKFLWYKPRVKGVRVITLGLKEEFRRTGLAPLFYLEIFRRGTRKGHTFAESSWVLEDNHIMRGAAEKMGFRLYKIYRLYERALTP
ncbi:MAG: GNAT family N-acetyltransferase [Gemmatimonadota bacterium]|nr:MAG: GNAT family N-acetyltransferase [Gemmatimonadota bacterium]